MNSEVDLARGWLVKAASDIGAARLVVDGEGPTDALLLAEKVFEIVAAALPATHRPNLPEYDR